MISAKTDRLMISFYNLKVHTLGKEEVFKDIVRVSKKYRPSSNGKICRIATKNKSILASVRGIDSDRCVIKIDEINRDKLGININSSYGFTIVRATWFSILRWHVLASDPSIRIPAILGVSSLFLGIISILIAIFS